MAFLFRRKQQQQQQQEDQNLKEKEQDKLAPPPPLPPPPLPTVTGLDLVFAVDCTGSMASYIAAAQQNIRAIVDGISRQEQVRVRFGLVCYRDHPPQESTYVTQTFPFTSDVAEMKAHVDTMRACGGGDGPEAVADALFEVLHMEWHPDAAKVAVLIADAPPHGLGEACDGFPNGCPADHDPLAIARQLAERGVTMYTVGCEPALSAFFAAKDFLISLAELTSGMALRLESSALLAEVILGTAVEELALMRLQREVAGEIEDGLAQGLSEATVVAQVEGALRRKGTRSKQLRTTMRLHPQAAPHARAISASHSMAEARTHVTRAAAAVQEADDGGVMPAAGGAGPALAALGRSVSSRAIASAAPCVTFCCAAPVAAAAAAAPAMAYAAPLTTSSSSSSSSSSDEGASSSSSSSSSGTSGFGPLIAGLLNRRGGAHPPPPPLERGGSCGSQRWLAAATHHAALAAAASTGAEPSGVVAAGVTASELSAAEAEGDGSSGIEVCEDEVSTDQVLRLVRKAQSLRQRLGASQEGGKEDGAPVLRGGGGVGVGVGVASAHTL